MSLAFWVGQLCEEFHCLPSVALEEWYTLPGAFLDEVIEARRYAEAKRLWDQNRKRAELPVSAWIDLVEEIDMELAAEELASQSRKQNADE